MSCFHPVWCWTSSKILKFPAESFWMWRHDLQTVCLPWLVQTPACCFCYALLYCTAKRGTKPELWWSCDSQNLCLRPPSRAASAVFASNARPRAEVAFARSCLAGCGAGSAVGVLLMFKAPLQVPHANTDVRSLRVRLFSSLVGGLEASQISVLYISPFLLCHPHPPSVAWSRRGPSLRTFPCPLGFPLSEPSEAQFLQRTNSCKILVGRDSFSHKHPILSETNPLHVGPSLHAALLQPKKEK